MAKTNKKSTVQQIKILRPRSWGLLLFVLFGLVIVFVFYFPRHSFAASQIGCITTDSTVDSSDLTALINDWGTNTTSADLNGDGTVNVLDLSILISDWGNSCSSTTSNSIYWGAYIEGTQTYNYLYGGTWSNAPWCDPGTMCPLPKFESNAGKQVSIEHWGMCWGCTYDNDAADLVEGRGDIPAIDWGNDDGPTDAAIASGQYDSYITAQAQAMKANGHPMFLLFDEKMNGTWYTYSPGQNGNTAADFVAMWQHVHDIFTSVGATNVTWVWDPNVDGPNSDPGNTFTPLSAVYPGDNYVDWVGLNGYNWGSGPGGGWFTFSQVFTNGYDELLRVAPSKPIMIGEMASEEVGGSKAAWITDALSTQIPYNFPQIKAMLWFNWRINQNGQYWNWEIESSAASQQAFAQAISSSYYLPGGSYGNLPLLTKVPTP